jgi:peroxiredoxin
MPMVAEEVPSPLKAGEAAPAFTLPRADQDGTVSLDDFQGRPLLLTLMRGVQCPFCRRNVAALGQIAPALRQIGVETLAVVGTTAERARLYFRYRPASIALAADPELEIHRHYGLPCHPVTPDLLDQYRATRVDPFHELPVPVPLLGSDGTEAHDVFDRLDGFVPTDVDQRDRTRQFRTSMQLCGQYMLDSRGIVRWAHVEGTPGGLATAGIFPGETTLMRIARSL